MNERLPTYGGQAVIEGVMMRGSQSVAIAMRAPNQEIVIHTEPLVGIYKSRIGKIPFLRGVIGLWDALVLGMRALTLSANLQSDEEEKLEGPALYLTLGASLLIAVGLFMLLPIAASHLFTKVLGLSAVWLILAEGVLRLGIVVGYIWAVGRSAEIRRVFAYHGAEHKTINAFEAGAELTPENVSRYSLEHPRCGTAFLLSLVLLGIFVFSLLSPLSMLWQYLGRILLLPVLAGLAYEYIRWTANHLDAPLVRLIVRPNLALQHLTTREPSLEMLEVSIAAFKAMHSQERQLNL
ncbi:MAG: DUF1385 domain-containing protein [Chloroflexota bacterium]